MSRVQIEEAFERAGVRQTPQRFVVPEHLMTRPEHASGATVYKTLHTLVEAGLFR